MKRLKFWRNGHKRRLPFRVHFEKWMPSCASSNVCLSTRERHLPSCSLPYFAFYFICALKRCRSSISQTSQMLDLQGNVIDTFHSGENRQSVPLKDISPYLIEATLAIEDQRFYDHLGFDIKGMARAAVVNVKLCR